jgi:NAD(P)-dependent dehydrogenase (short-subunit alcohol dehydrogenase family)
MTVRALADFGHVVYAGIGDIGGRNQRAAEDAAEYARTQSVRLRAVELDASRQDSVDAAIDTILSAEGRLDVVVHNAGQMVLGPAEAFTPEQLMSVYDTSVVSAHRVNRAALPHLRAQGSGLLVWVGSSTTSGGALPYLAPYVAAKAAEDALALSYAAELARFGIDTTIIVPGAFTSPTNHFANAGHPDDMDVVDAYEARCAGLLDQVAIRLADPAPGGTDPQMVAAAIVWVVHSAPGCRPFRVHVDPADDGAETVDRVGDLARRDLYRRVGIEDPLAPARDPQTPRPEVDRSEPVYFGQLRATLSYGV